MKRLLRKLLLSLFMVLAMPGWHSLAGSVCGSYEQRLYNAFITGNMAEWVKVLDELELDVREKPTPANRFELLHAQYGYIGYLLAINHIDKAEGLIEKAELNADALVDIPKYKAAAMSIQAALIAYRILISPYKAPFLGPRSMSLIDEALAINPSSIYALIEKGNAKHYAPSFVGGNPLEAIELYRKAIALTEKQWLSSPPKTWWYINTYTQMGLAAQKAGNKTLAKNIYLKILSIEPNYRWVKEELLPKVSR